MFVVRPSLKVVQNFVMDVAAYPRPLCRFLRMVYAAVSLFAVVAKIPGEEVHLVVRADVVVVVASGPLLVAKAVRAGIDFRS